MNNLLGSVFKSMISLVRFQLKLNGLGYFD